MVALRWTPSRMGILAAQMRSTLPSTPSSAEPALDGGPGNGGWGFSSCAKTRQESRRRVAARARRMGGLRKRRKDSSRAEELESFWFLSRPYGTGIDFSINPPLKWRASISCPLCGLAAILIRTASSHAEIYND